MRKQWHAVWLGSYLTLTVWLWAEREWTLFFLSLLVIGLHALDLFKPAKAAAPVAFPKASADPADTPADSGLVRTDAAHSAAYEELTERIFWLQSERRKQIRRRGKADTETTLAIIRAEDELDALEREMAAANAARLSSAGDNVVAFPRRNA